MKRKLSLLLCVVMLVSQLSACGTTKNATNTTTTATTTTVDSKNGEQSERKYGTKEDGPLGYYEEPITIRFARGMNDVTMDRINKLEGITGENINDNRYTRLYKNELNIKTEYMWIVDDSQADQKLQLALASGDIPDVMEVPLANMKTLSDSGMIWDDLMPYYDKYTSEDVKKFVNLEGESRLQSVMLDGKLKGFPDLRNNMDDVLYMWVREDWMSKLNLKTPKTIAELETVIKAFTEQDPDGNGIKDTYGIAAENKLWYHFGPIFNAYGAYPAVSGGKKTPIWVKTEKGTIEYGQIQPEMKEPLRLLQKWYKNGWIDPEFPMKSELSETKAMINANKIGIDIAGFWELENLGTLAESVPGVEWSAYEMPRVDINKPVVYGIGAGANRAMVINKKFKNPEALFKLLNLYTEASSKEAGYYQQDPQMPVTRSLSPFNISSERMVDIYRATRDVVNGKADISTLKMESYKELVKNIGGHGMITGTYKAGDKAAGFHMDNIEKNGWYIGNAFFGLPTPTMIERQGTLEELGLDAFIKIISSDVNVDTAFDKFVQDWYAQGGTQITKEVNDWYKTLK